MLVCVSEHVCSHFRKILVSDPRFGEPAVQFVHYRGRYPSPSSHHGLMQDRGAQPPAVVGAAISARMLICKGIP